MSTVEQWHEVYDWCRDIQKVAQKVSERVDMLASEDPAEAARQYIRGEISAGKFGELLGLQPGELHDFKTAVHAFCENSPAIGGEK